MNYSCARLRLDGRWDYTRNGLPYGYCCEYKPIPEDAKWISAEQAKRHNEEMAKLAHKFHTDGHTTKEEACECYKQYLLDTKLRLMPTEPENAHQQFKCKACGKWTACHASVGPYRQFDLCPEHQTREEVEKLLTVGESWES